MTLYQRLNIRCYHRARSALGPLLSFADCLRVAPSNPGVNLPLAVRGFFENGGQQCFISQIAASDPLESGLARLAARRTSRVLRIASPLAWATLLALPPL